MILILKIKPMHLKDANEFVRQYHRHNLPTVGGKFAVGCCNNDILCGVAICGRPTARQLDDGFTLEIYRNCTDGTRNACSKLYSACVKVASAMGYRKVVTYILASENGASVKAANFICDSEKSGLLAPVGARNKDAEVPHEMKKRYCFYI